MRHTVEQVHSLEREIGRLIRRVSGARADSTNAARSDLRSRRAQRKTIEESNHVDSNTLKRTLTLILKREADTQQAKGELNETNLHLGVSIAQKYTNRRLQV